MRVAVLCTLLSATVLVAGASAQSTTGTISGQVVDNDNLGVPGATVTATSPAMQGVRETVTSANGDFIITLLPPGIYSVTFELSGFQTQMRSVSVAPTQSVPLNVTMGLGGVTETIVVEARVADVLVQTAQVATNFNQESIATLPGRRDVRSTMLLAPAVHASGPAGNFSVAGSMSTENLFMVNGVNVNENIRGQPQNLIIEDAIQETTVSTTGISAEFGRFGGGVVNVITKSGGNQFSASFRDTLTNDKWRALVPRREGDPYTGDSKTDKTVPTYEYTVGGPVIRDRLWFFTAGRLTTQTFNRQLVITNIPYEFEDKSGRYEAKVTYAADASHRVQGVFTKINRDQVNTTQSTATSMDLNSLYSRSLPEDLFTMNYTGVLARSLFVEGRYSQRHSQIIGSGSPFTDLQKGTLLVDPSGRRYHAATFCFCNIDERDNQDIFVKASYFLSSKNAGSHNVVSGYDLFNDIRTANNHQSGSDYRILNAPAIVEGTNVIASFRSGTSIIQWNPIFVESQGTDLKTHSLFINDTWRVNGRLTANLGLRWDRNDGVNSNDEVVATQSAFSPRLGVIWDPNGQQRWSITGSVSKYVAGVLNSVFDQTSPAGVSDDYRFVYGGPDINVDPARRVSNEAAVQQVFDWFNANGGAGRPTTGSPSVRGVSPQVGPSLAPPHVWEYSSGVNRQFGARGAFRADFVYRNYKDFYIQRTDLTTGRAVDNRSFAPAAVRGRSYDLTLYENDTDGLLKRRYAGVSLQGQYRMASRLDLGANYTVSRAWGNLEGETVASGAVPAGDSGRAAVLHYPEYSQVSWNAPEGDLSIDQRHRARIFATVTPWVPGFTVSVIEALESGVPYSASNFNGASLNGVDTRLYVANPGYLTPPDGSTMQYYFTERDAFRMEGQRRTDLALMYTHRIAAGGGRNVELHYQAQIINLFDQYQLCGCGGDATFTLGGNIQNNTIDTTVLTAVSTPARFQSFNPFTTTPVEGTHWAKGPNFGKALNRFAYTTPRTFLMTFGVRF